MRNRSQVWGSHSADQGKSWSAPRFVFANALAETWEGGFRNHQCSYLDLIADGADLHLFVPHRWQRVVHLPADDVRRLSTQADLGIAR
jgi:hypothetical protein